VGSQKYLHPQKSALVKKRPDELYARCIMEYIEQICGLFGHKVLAKIDNGLTPLAFSKNKQTEYAYVHLHVCVYLLACVCVCKYARFYARGHLHVMHAVCAYTDTQCMTRKHACMRTNLSRGHFIGCQEGLPHPASLIQCMYVTLPSK